MVENWIFEFFYVTCRHSTCYHAYFIYLYWVAVVLQLCRFMGDTFVVYQVMFHLFTRNSGAHSIIIVFILEP